MSILRKLSTALLTVLALAVAIGVPLLSTTSAIDLLSNNRTPVVLYGTCVASGDRAGFLAARADCDDFATNATSFSTYEQGVFRPATPNDPPCVDACDCTSEETRYLCLGVPGVSLP